MAIAMSLRLGFDMDGVLADLNQALVREALRLFPDSQESKAPPPSPGPDAFPAAPGGDVTETTPSSLALTSRQERELWDAIRSTRNFWETLDETEPGIVSRLAATATERRWDVIFLTSRPVSAGDPVQIQSQRWLQRLGFPLPALYVVSTSRGRIAHALELDVVVDDRPENCLDVAIDSKARAILIWRGTEGGVPASARRLGIGGVPTVAACLDLLVEADTEAPDGLVSRLTKLLRLKSSAPARAGA